MSILGDLPTKQQIVDYLTEQNFASSYACSNGTQCNTFNKRVSVEAINKQVKERYHTIRWCEFDTTNNRFVYEVAYFDNVGQPITHTQFNTNIISQFGNETAERLFDVYGPASKIYFESSGTNQWTANKTEQQIGGNNKIIKIN